MNEVEDTKAWSVRMKVAGELGGVFELLLST
jgi:hypothetical protein